MQRMPASRLTSTPTTPTHIPAADTRPPHELADPDSAFITVDGIRLHYKELAVGQVGPGSPTLLLVHGFNGSLFNW